MLILLDTSILIAYSQPKHKRHGEVIERLLVYRRIGAILLIAPQCLYESYSVVTRPERSNGYNLRPDEADEMMSAFCRNFILSAGNELEMAAHWRKLVKTYGVSGRPAHDARLVAWMLANGVGRILTLNPKDFVRYQPQIEVLTVEENGC